MPTSQGSEHLIDPESGEVWRGRGLLGPDGWARDLTGVQHLGRTVWRWHRPAAAGLEVHASIGNAEGRVWP